MKVDRFDDPGSQHMRPEPVDDVAAKVAVGSRADRIAQLCMTTVGGDRTFLFVLLVRSDLPFLAPGELGVGDGLVAGQLRFTQSFDAGKHGFELRRPFRLFGKHGGFLLVRLKERQAVYERIDPVVFALHVVIDPRMIMALGALKVLAEKDATDVTSEGGGFGFPLQVELGGRVPVGLRTVSAQQFLSKSVEGLVL